MASIRIWEKQDGSKSYQVDIRKKGLSIKRTFTDEEDAKLFANYKERLIDNMENFEVPLKNRVTLRSIFEIKISSVDASNKRMIDELNCTLDRLEKILGSETFVSDLTFEKWLNASKILYETPVFIGYNKEKNQKKMTLKTFRRILASASSVFSFANEKGIELENHPLSVIQKYINPLMRKNEKALLPTDQN